MRAFFHVLSVIAAVLLGIVWFMSPLGLEFAKWPVDDGLFSVKNIYSLSYFIGLPFLAVAQVSSVILAFTRFHRGGLPLSAVSLCLHIFAIIYVGWGLA